MFQVDIILVNYNNAAVTLECMNSLKKSVYPVRKIVLVDNSDKEGGAFNEPHLLGPLVKYIKSSRNLGFAGGNNVGIKESLKDSPDFILLLNNDTIVKEDFLQNIIAAAAKEKADLATGKIYYHSRPDIIWAAGGRIDWGLGIGKLCGSNQKDAEEFDKRREVSFISGCMMLVKSEVFNKIGLLDEKYFMYYEDVDFCLKAAQAKLRLIYVPDSVIWHKVGAMNPNSNTFYFYYFFRNSIFMIRKFASLRQKTFYCFWGFIYFFMKFLQAVFSDVRFFPAFFLAVFDGLSGRDGAREYGFLRKA